ncbi:Saposin B-type domain-containing protein [Aphelenchoides bicaudatus]|nr:Saposin B-type domain-containing protein [Aphelenchoides bicaudatus]
MKLLWALLFCTVVTVYSQDFICSMCTELIQSLEDELQEDEPDIVKKANELCDKLTGGNDFLDPICKQLIDMEIENVIDDIENKEKPQGICVKMGACKNDN